MTVTHEHELKRAPMNRHIWSWLAIPFALLLTGCPDGGGGEGGGFAGPEAIVYRANTTGLTTFELFLAGSGTKLNPPLGSTQTVQAFALTPDKSNVVYIADQDTPGVFEIFRVSLSNPGFAIKLNPTGATGISSNKDVLTFKIIPDGSGVVYLADQDTDGVIELYLVRFASPGETTKLNATLTANRNVLDFDVTANSAIVVYRADQDIDEVSELYQKTIGSTVVPAKLHTDYIAGRSVTSFKLLPDSSGVIYLADEDTDEIFEIFHATFGIAGGHRVNTAFTLLGSDVLDFVISPDSSSVVYRADQDTDGVNELYLVALAALTNSVKLNGSLTINGDVDSHYVITANSSSVVYVADQDVDNRLELYHTVFTDMVRTKLTGSLIDTRENVYDVVSIPNSSGVVYIADQDTPGIREVYRVLFANPGASLKLNPVPMAGNVNEAVVASNSRSVIYRADQTTSGTIELYQTFFSSLSNTKLSTSLNSGSDVTGFAL